LKKQSIGIVETKYFTFAAPPDEMVLESGQKLGPITLAYETYGELDQNRGMPFLRSMPFPETPTLRVTTRATINRAGGMI